MPPSTRPRKTKAAEVDRYLSDNIIKQFRKADPGFNSEKLLEAIIHHWGGPEKFALDVVAEFKLMQAGSVQRQRLLDMVNKLIMHVSARREPERDFDLMSNEELLEAAGEILGDLTKRDADGSPTQATPCESTDHGSRPVESGGD